jgi:hypothetical protein
MMLRVNWKSFGANVRAHSVAEAMQFSEIEKRLGISHARMVNAAQGKPLGTEIFLTLCHWMDQHPMWFCHEEQEADIAAVSLRHTAEEGPLAP